MPSELFTTGSGAQGKRDSSSTATNTEGDKDEINDCIANIRKFCIASREATPNIQEEPFVKTVIDDYEFKLPSYYKPQRIIGRGSYAVVVQAVDIRDGKKVAIKRNFFPKELGDARRVLRELLLLLWFEHEDIVALLDIIPIRSEDVETFEEIYMVLELMETDLSSILRMQSLTDAHRQIIVYQILRAFKYMHSAGVVHRDVKPQNILLSAFRTRTVVTDFGCSKSLESPADLTEYVCTRWYRAPEIYLCSRNYDEASDIWSLGCIMAEMFRDKPLFPGPSRHREQLSLIFKTMGPLTDVEWIKNPRARRWARSNWVGDRIDPKEKLRAQVPKITDDALDLLEKMLRINPEKRITAAEALNHPWLRVFRNRSTETTCPSFECSFEYDPRIHNISGVRSMIYEVIQQYQQEMQAEKKNVNSPPKRGPARPDGHLLIWYTSTFTTSSDESMFNDICTKAHRNNKRCMIGGFITLDEATKQICQLIEGPSKPMERLWKRISNDPRHVIDKKSIVKRRIENRQWPGEWGMIVLRDDEKRRLAAESIARIQS